MSDALTTFLITWLFWWVLLSTTYAALLLAADALLTAWQRRQQKRRVLRQQLARIDRDADATIRRMGAAFVMAQQLVREQHAEARGGKPA